MKVDFIIALLIVFFGLNIQAYAAKEKYKVSDIPPELLEGSKAVLRNENVKFILNSEKGATLEISYAITILNENGKKLANLVVWYNKLRKVRNISGKVYDKDGKVVDRVNLDDIFDYSAIAGYSLFEDTRIKGFESKYGYYPYTVEYSYTIEYKGVLICPNWFPYKSYNMAVEESTFQVCFPVDNPVRYYMQNIFTEPDRMMEGADSVITWTLRGLPAIREEPFSPVLSRCSPGIYTAPTNFKISGYEGNAETWENFGAWCHSLNEGKDALPNETKEQIQKIIVNADNDREKIRLLYEYMQNKTRYVNIAIGIGGWKPIEAETVDRLGYGDCKGLANYMMAILDEAGIKSYYTLVRAGENAIPMIPEFPSSQFNHVILNVPLENDTIWLECTSQRLPSGFLGDFTDDRMVLVISEDRSKISHTPVYGEDKNRRNRLINVKLDGSGGGKVNISSSYSGIHYGNMVNILHDNRDDQEEYLLRRTKIPSFQMTSFSYEETRYPEPVIYENLELAVRNYTSLMGKRIILPLDIMNDWKILPTSLDERRTEILIRRSESFVDSVIYTLPDNCSIENMSSPVSLDSDFGTYEYNITREAEKIIYTRSLRLKKGLFPPEMYGELQDFYRKVRKADQAKVILKRE
jgi:hypothetical protein